MWIVDLRRDRRAVKRGTRRWVSTAAAARQMADGRVAVLLEDSTSSDETDAAKPLAPPTGLTSALIDPLHTLKDTLSHVTTPDAKAAQPLHLFILSRSTLVSEQKNGRRRLHHFGAATDASFEADQKPMAELLLRLGCASRALPPPRLRDTLVRFEQSTDVAGLQMEAGAVAALDFDPLSVLPQFRGLGLYPWEVLPIERLDGDGCHGSAIDEIRLVLRLDRPWQPWRSPGFLAGVFVDSTYRDYRRQPPAGKVLRAYFTHGDKRPPRAVLAKPEG